MLHRNHNANLACRSCCSRYRKRVPDRRWWAGLGDGFLSTEEYQGRRGSSSSSSNRKYAERCSFWGSRGRLWLAWTARQLRRGELLPPPRERGYRRTYNGIHNALPATVGSLQLNVHVVQPGSFRKNLNILNSDRQMPRSQTLTIIRSM